MEFVELLRGRLSIRGGQWLGSIRHRTRGGSRSLARSLARRLSASGSLSLTLFALAQTCFLCQTLDAESTNKSPMSCVELGGASCRATCYMCLWAYACVSGSRSWCAADLRQF